jgi:hypothetical protein
MPLNLADLSWEANRIAGEVAISFQDDYFEKLRGLIMISSLSLLVEQIQQLQMVLVQSDIQTL